MTTPVITWLPYQQRWLADDARFKIGMFTRRGGKTFGAGGEIVDSITRAEMEGRRERWTILSRSERTAHEAMHDAVIPITRAFWAAYGVHKAQALDLVEGEFRGQDATYKTFEVKMPGGSRVTALSASPDAARGFGGNLLLDEFAFHRDSRAIWGAAFPVAARGGHKIRVISTPNGKGNKFYELWTDKTGKWSRHRADIHEAVEQGLDMDVAELQAGMNDPDRWAQEFELAFIDGASAWLSYDLIAQAEAEAAGDPSAYAGGAVYVGVDIAARNDLFVIWVAEDVGGILVTREVIARRRITFAEQDALLDDVMSRYRVIRCAMDQTGMGEKPVEDAQRRYGTSRVEGVIFSAARKLDLATELKTRMEDRTLLIPAGDPVLRADLHAVTSVTGPTGARRLVAGADTDGHADRFWAAALAAGAAVSDYQPLAYDPVRGTGGERDFNLTAGWRSRTGMW
ncbi:MAG: terminase large subunit domain-containing protein [Paracoccaceae bacterium]